MSNSFSNSIINSTVSSESAPKSFVKLASVFTSFSSTPSLSTIIAVTFAEILFNFCLVADQKQSITSLAFLVSKCYQSPNISMFIFTMP